MLEISTLIEAPLQETWAQYNNPEAIMLWNHASDDWHCTRAINDFKENGRFSYTMAATDDSASFTFGGTYKRIIPLEHITYRLDDGRKVTVDFERKGNLTLIRQFFDPESSRSEEVQLQGWQAILDNFKNYMETQVGTEPYE